MTKTNSKNIPQIICYLIALVFFGIVIIACQEEKIIVPTKISNNIEKLSAKHLLISHIASGLLDTLPVEKETPLSLELSEPTILTLSEGRKQHYVYVQPEQAIELVKNETIISTSEPSKENNYLIEFAKLQHKANKDFDTDDLAKTEVDSFINSLFKKYKQLEALNRKIVEDASLTAYFKTAVKNRLAAALGNDMLSYDYLYEYHHKRKPFKPDNFYDGIEIIPLDETLLLFKDGKDFGDQLNMKGISYKDYPSLGAYFTDTYHRVSTTFSKSLVQDFFAFKALENQVSVGTGIDGIDEMLADFESKNPNTYFTKKLARVLSPWKNLKKGMPAPNFSGFAPDGEKILLSDLKGKRVYVDVWATWCGPCVAEIPSLKKLETTFHPAGVEFLSISIDEEFDKQFWLDYIKDHNLGGIQLLADGAWKADVMKNYNIRGIPRFLLIDETGKIVSANAPRPSSEEVVALIESNL